MLNDVCNVLIIDVILFFNICLYKCLKLVKKYNMFVPNSRIISRLADCRIDGRVDEHFEHELGNDNNKFDYDENIYNQRERMQEVVNDIMETDTSLTSVDKYGSQAEYDKAMSGNLGTDKYSMENKERYTRSHYMANPTVYNGAYEVTNQTNTKVKRNDNLGHYINDMCRRQEHPEVINKQSDKQQYSSKYDEADYEDVEPILKNSKKNNTQYKNNDKAIVPRKQQYSDNDYQYNDDIDMSEYQYEDEHFGRESFGPRMNLKEMFNKTYICIKKNTLIAIVVGVIIALLLIYSICVHRKLSKIQNQQFDMNNKMSNMKIVPLANTVGGFNNNYGNNTYNNNRNNNNYNNANDNNGFVYLRSPDPPINNTMNINNNTYNDII